MTVTDKTLSLPRIPRQDSADGKAPRRPAFRPEIEGLRAIAVLLVAVYHIWFGRVSGGVDVFLFLTGFFITGSLLRMVEGHGRVRPLRFLARLAKRLLPTAAVVLLGVLTATYLWVPSEQWSGVVGEVFASALYFENWALASDSVDYLAREGTQSPVQHFWSMSIQGQFYLVWAVLFALLALLAKLTSRKALKLMALGAMAAVFAASFAYSVHLTAANQQLAYFHTGTRLWEFALGGATALLIAKVKLPMGIRVAIGWLGLAGLVLCGALVNVSAMFPGWIALWPTAAALFVLLAGNTGKPYAADRLLTLRPLAVLGSWSYALYLWHWPVLVFYLHVSGREEATWRGGFYVIAASLVLAAATTYTLERPLLKWKPQKRIHVKALAAGLAFVVPVAAAAHVAGGLIDQKRYEAQRATAEAASDFDNYPGALTILRPEEYGDVPERDFVPSLEDDGDYPQLNTDGCDPGLKSAEAKVCEYGDPDSDRTVMLVGASRVGHWFPAFEHAALNNGWRLLTLSKSGCQFTVLDGAFGYEREIAETCEQWNEDAIPQIERYDPDLVVALGSRALYDREEVPPGFAERWEVLDRMGVPVLAVRDIPRRRGRLDDCIRQKSVEECSYDLERSLDPVPPQERYENVPDNVTFVDFGPYVCPDDSCPAVMGNVRTFRDAAHLNATFAATLWPAAADAVKQKTGWLGPRHFEDDLAPRAAVPALDPRLRGVLERERPGDLHAQQAVVDHAPQGLEVAAVGLHEDVLRAQLRGLRIGDGDDAVRVGDEVEEVPDGPSPEQVQRRGDTVAVEEVLDATDHSRAVRDRFGPEVLQVAEVAFGGGPDDSRGAHRLRGLDGHGAHSPGCGVDDDHGTLAGLDGEEALVGGQPRQGQAGGLGPAEPGGTARDHVPPGLGVLAVGPPLDLRVADVAHDLVALGVVADLGAGALDDAGDVPPGYEREAARHGRVEVSGGDLPVDRVDARGDDADEHLVGFDLRGRHVVDAQLLLCPVFGHDDGSHAPMTTRSAGT